MTSPETLNMRLAANGLSFPLVTDTVDSDIWFDSYGVLKSGQGAENFLDRLNIPMKDQALRQKMHES
jgi:hypothetical protein